MIVALLDFAINFDVADVEVGQVLEDVVVLPARDKLI